MKLLLPLILLFQSLLISASSLLAVDYGTDGFKASLIKPGIPFDVLINKDSKRKTPSLVTMRGEERAFGGEAANLVCVSRFPSVCTTPRANTPSTPSIGNKIPQRNLLLHQTTPRSSIHPSPFLSPPISLPNTPINNHQKLSSNLLLPRRRNLSNATNLCQRDGGRSCWREGVGNCY